MADDRLASILARQKAAADKRAADEEAQLQRAVEDQRRAQHLATQWSEVEKGLRKQVSELNKAMEANGAALQVQLGAGAYGIPHSVVVRYKISPDPGATNYALRINVNEHGLLLVGIGRGAATDKREQMNIADFDGAKQLDWLIEFLDLTTADARAGA